MSLADQLLAGSVDGMLAFDREQRLVFWNAAMERMTGLRAVDVLGRRVSEVLPFLVETGEDALLARALEGETLLSTDRPFMVVETGRGGTYDARYTPWRGEETLVIGGLAVLHDTTEAKLAERRVRETESRFRNMADVSPVLLWMSGTDSLCTFFNQTWLDFTGRTLADEWGVGWAEGVHFEDFQRCVDTYEAAFNARRVFEMEYRLRRRDGQFRWILDRGTPRYGPDGTFVGYIGSCVDITERRALEQELRQAVTTRDEFLSIASHELRTPLSALRLQADGMIRNTSRGIAIPPERTDRAWRAVQTGVERLEGLIANLLDVSKMGGTGPVLRLETVDLAKVVRDVCERLGSQAEAAHCSITVDAPPRVPGLWDPMRLDQIVSNLLTNALKYGAGHPVVVSLDADSRTARLTVKDGGIGIAPDDHARIFERFERAVSTTSYGGLGLGLWIVRQIVLALEGDIRVESAAGEGATFTITLPRGAFQ